MKLRYLGQESQHAFCEFVREAPHDVVWEAIFDAERIMIAYPSGSEGRSRIEEIVTAATCEYEKRFGHEFIPF